jgi:phosphonate transport system substrate-binding protein
MARVTLVFSLMQRSLKWWLIFPFFLLAASYALADEFTYQPSFSLRKPKSQVSEYIVGIHPLHNPQRLMETYGPIVDYINANIPEAVFRLEASRNYEEYERKLYIRHFAFAMPNPYQTLQSLKYGYRIFGKMGDDEDFTGVILVRKDSGIKEVTDLKGKAVAYPAPTALAATMMPQYFLQTHGIDVNRDIENRYVGSQESAIINVLRGYVAAGATWPVPWKAFVASQPELANQLEVKWETPALVNNGWVVRNDIPPAIVDKFARLLFSLHEHEAGKIMLSRLPISRFEPANAETYRSVSEFLEKFSKTVRKVEY